MSKLELITADNVERIEQIGEELAESYKVAFAGPPWNERSRCPDQDCEVVLTGFDPGCECNECGSAMLEAYEAPTLIDSWKTIVGQDNGIIEVSFADGFAQRATIARPTYADELFERKYNAVAAMEGWLKLRFGEEPLVWIEDTFANRERVPTGNLVGRGETLERIASFYGGMRIATRTLSPAIVASTFRDKKTSTIGYVGSKNIGSAIMSDAMGNPGYDLPTVPDTRTLLVIN